MNRLILAAVVSNALNEDIQQGDLTSEAIFTEHTIVAANFRLKSSGVLAGFPVVSEVFRQLDPTTQVTADYPEGAALEAGTKLGSLKGSVKSLLAGERVALNFLQHLSGIATQTASLAHLVREFPVRVVDTRKTTPGLRYLEKYAVRQGGGFNHRFSLADAVLIKDNHIAACGSVTAAITRVRGAVPHTTKIEVEVENESQVREAIAAKADIIMLDNMSPALMAEMVKLINHQAIVEASGNITADTIKAVAATGVDVISVGALTHSVRALDISLEFE